MTLRLVSLSSGRLFWMAGYGGRCVACLEHRRIGGVLCRRIITPSGREEWVPGWVTVRPWSRAS